jgi:transglycosylase-like protein with SLT domain
MQQFRPLPKFDKVEVAEPAEAQPVATTDAIPTLASQTTGHTPVLLLSGSQRMPVTDQLAALANKPASAHSSLANVLQRTLGSASTSKRVVVIHAESKRKRKKASQAPARHMSLRLRHALVIFATLVVLLGFMISLSPLSDGANGLNFFSDFSTWIHSVQTAFGIQVQGHTFTKADLNANLPFMNIPDSPYLLIAEQDAIDAGISPVYFVRQITQESGFNPKAVSVTNAQGIAQFEPGTAAGLGINAWDPVQALRGAAQLMARYSQKYGGYAQALAAYNAGSGGLLAAEKACGANWLNCTPAQTRDYVHRIMGL